MLKALAQLYNRIITKNQSLSLLQSLASLYKLQGFESNCTIPQSPPYDLDPPTRRFICYYWRFAYVAFGKIRILENLKDYWQHNDDLVAQLVRNRSDLIHSFWGRRGFYPGNFVVVDHDTKMVIWGIRATLCPEDVVVDVMADPMPFLGGYAHQGMVSAVGRLIQDVWRTIEVALESNTGYNLLITGHSLGGGMTTLLTLYIRHHNPRVACFGLAFASPPCVCRDLATISQSFVLGVTCQNDVIARLSFPSFFHLKQKLYLIHHVGSEQELEEHGYIKQGNWVLEEDDTTTTRLWLPRNQVYLETHQSSKVDGFAFDKIIISHFAIWDHSHTTYERYLARLSEKQGSQ